VRIGPGFHSIDLREPAGLDEPRASACGSGSMIIEPSAPVRVVFKRGSGRRTEAGQVRGLPFWACARTGAGRSATDFLGARDRVLLAERVDQAGCARQLNCGCRLCCPEARKGPVRATRNL